MRLFGTDGIRAPFGDFPLDRETVIRLGFHLGNLLRERTDAPLVILAGDTRASTPVISRWLAAGLDASGASLRFGGVLPTPAIAKLVIDLGAHAGVAVSASHNPLPDNGIKLFDSAGCKWSPEAELDLERRLESPPLPLPQDSTDLEPERALADSYLSFLRGLAGESSTLAGLRLVIDSAHGAASPFAPRLFRDLGAEVISLGDRPDGSNINDGHGSTRPEAMVEAVRKYRAAMGIAFDGDADRAIFADEGGEVRDGDAILYLWAGSLLRSGKLDPARIVATSMSNLGLERALEPLGIGVVRCDVGDRTVVTTMQSHGILLGGEQSGHIVRWDLTTTGDGLVTAVQVAEIVSRSKTSLSELLAAFRRFPQILRNVPVKAKPELRSLPRVVSAAREVERRLGTDGRLVLRYSGTEPLARVMIEGPDAAEIETMAELLITAIRRDLGSP